MNSTETIGIINRFFEACEYLKETGTVHGVSVIAKKLGADRRNMLKARSNPEGHTLQLGFLSTIVTEYNVSAEWLLTGKGNIINGTKV